MSALSRLLRINSGNKIFLESSIMMKKTIRRPTCLLGAPFSNPPWMALHLKCQWFTNPVNISNSCCRPFSQSRTHFSARKEDASNKEIDDICYYLSFAPQENPKTVEFTINRLLIIELYPKRIHKRYSYMAFHNSSPKLATPKSRSFSGFSI